MNFYVLTLFPEIIRAGLGYSVMGRAMARGALEVVCVNIRDFAGNPHGAVDDYPYGGGPGMVLRAQPVYDAYAAVKQQAGDARVLHMTPQGRRFDQPTARALAAEPALVLLCGHYEGIDERALEAIVTDEISIGDYVLSGGELAALVVMDAVARMVPGVLKEQSREDESFTDNLLEYPQYTRPALCLGRPVPPVLLSGHHGQVDAWRAEQKKIRTRKKRPDLL
jgi:tRNA (guanine37-N1)-methyltransferase